MITVDRGSPSMTLQWRIQDYPEVGASTPKVDVLTYYFANLLPKTAWKWKNVDPERGRPLGSANELAMHM